MPLDTRILVDLKADLSSTSFDLATPSATVRLAQQISLASGTGLNAADRVWSDTRTIAPSATDSLDLAGSFTDVFGIALTFARIKTLLVRAVIGNTNNVNVTRPATFGVPWLTAVSSGIPVMPGGLFLWTCPTAAGVVVTAATGDLIDVVNSAAGSSVTYDVVIIGASA
jgi:hypothetical protein